MFEISEQRKIGKYTQMECIYTFYIIKKKIMTNLATTDRGLFKGPQSKIMYLLKRM